MARLREFDPKEALDKAMMVFWQKGYLDTSIDDLVEATGVSRYGLYGEFGNKREFFMACLDHYQDTAIKGLFACIAKPDAGLTEIRQYFALVQEVYLQPFGKRGCLMCNTATEVAPSDMEVSTKIRGAIERITLGFTRALENAKARGELSSETDARQTADFLAGVLLGASVMARSGASNQMIANTLERSLASI